MIFLPLPVDFILKISILKQSLHYTNYLVLLVTLVCFNLFTKHLFHEIDVSFGKNVEHLQLNHYK